MRLSIVYSLLLTTWTALAAYCPPASEQSGGMTDVMLLYMAPGHWPVEHLRPYVAYLDKRSGQPKDWRRLNKVFLDDLRQQFLIWRSIPHETMELYRERTLAVLGKTGADENTPSEDA